MHKKPTVVACIPAFKEEATIAKVVLSAQKFVDCVLVCDDGSPDMTAEIAEKLGAFVIRHEKNMGKGKAIKSLLYEALKYGADIVVLLDGDGQHDPSEIPNLIKPIEQGQADIVIGSRYLNKRNYIPFHRRIGLKVVDFLVKKVAKLNVNDTQCGYRAISRKALKIVSTFDADGYGVESEMLALAAKNGIRVVEVPINVKYVGLCNTSKRSPLLHGGELISTVFKLVVEERPLLYLGLPGLGFVCLGITLGTYLLWMFNVTRYFSISIAVLSVGFSLLGLLLVTTAIILHGLERIRKTMNSFQTVN